MTPAEHVTVFLLRFIAAAIRRDVSWTWLFPAEREAMLLLSKEIATVIRA